MSKLFANLKKLIASLLVFAVVLSLAPAGASAATCPSAASVQALPALKKGMSSSAVKTMQEALLCLGYSVPAGATGYYGGQTASAVLAFYTAKGNAAGVALKGEVFGPQGRSLMASDVSAQAGGGSTGTGNNAALIAVLLAMKASNPSMAATIDALIASLQGGTVPVAGKLSVALDSANPGSTNMVADSTNGGQAGVSFMAVKFMNSGSAAANITSLKVKRTGLSSDSDLDNVYLYDENGKLAEMSAFSSGVVTFSGSPLFSVPAGGSKVVWVKADLNKAASSGKTLAFQIVAATDIASSVELSGTFPISGNAMTVATVTDLANLRLATTSNSTTVDPGTSAFAAYKFQLITQNQAVGVSMIKFKQLGSAASGDVTNYSLYEGATKLADGVVGTDGTVTFNLPTYQIASGLTKNLEVRIDVIGGANRTVQFAVLTAADVTAMDKTYSVPIKVHSGTPGSYSAQSSLAATINTGSVVVTKASGSPVGNTVLNGTNVKLAEYSVTAYGEPLKVTSVTVNLTLTTATSIRNVRLMFDGAQIGTTQTTVNHNTDTAITTNFIIPVGQTKLLQIYADIQGTGLGGSDTILSTVKSGSSNALRMNSNLSTNFPAANVGSNTLTVQAGSLAAAKNPALVESSTTTPAAVKGQGAVRLGSFVLTAGPEGVQVSTIPVLDSSNAFNQLQNLVVKVDGTQVGTIQASLTGGQTYNFVPSASLTVPANGQKTVDLYADVKSGSATSSIGLLVLGVVSGTGESSGQAANSTQQNGQNIWIADSGTMTSIAVTSDTAVAQNLVMGTAGFAFGRFKLDASNSYENLNVTSVAVSDNTSDNGGIYNVKLFNGSTQVGSTIIALDTNGKATFNLEASPLVIAKNGYVTLDVKADVNAWPSAQNATHAVRILVNDVAYRGAVSQASATAPSATTTASTMTVRRSKLSVTGFAANGSTSGRVRSASDYLATLTARSDAAYATKLATTTFTISGNALSTAATTTAVVTLQDYDTGATVATTSVSFSTTTTSVSATLNLSASTTGFEIAAGASKSFKLLIDSSGFANGTGTDSLSVQLAATSDVKWRVVNEETATPMNIDTTGVAIPSTVSLSYE